MESVRWYRDGGLNSYWSVQSLIDKNMDQQIRFYGSFCKKSIYDVSFENDGFSGVETAEGTYDRDAKKTSITWTRPLDVSADESLTLQADTSYNVFLTWVTANKDEDASKFNSQDDVRSF